MAPTTLPARARRRHPAVEELEPRLTPAGAQPTPFEQALLERLNDARANPAAYGQSIGLNLSGVAATQPLAFDPRLIAAARAHSQDMNDRAFFSHFSSAGVNLPGRIGAAGFPWAVSYGESIAAGYATAEAVLAALVIDNGIPSLGHRRHLLAIDNVFKDLNQVGIGIVEGGSGPYVNYFTIDTTRTADGRPFLTGSVFNDLNNNGRYDIGEGVGNLTLQVHGVGTTTTFASGGYSFQLSPGTYTVTFSGPGLPAPVTKTVTVGATNQRLNLLTNREVQVGQVSDKPVVNQPPAGGTAGGGSSQPGGGATGGGATGGGATGGGGTSQPAPTNGTGQMPSTGSNQVGGGTQAPPSQPARSAAETWVAQLGLNLLRRALSDAEVQAYAAQIQQGGSRDAVIQAMANSGEFQTLALRDWVAVTGTDVMKRQPTAAEIAPWVDFLRRGGARETAVGAFMANAGYNYLSNAGWMTQLGRSLLQRELRPAELTAWTNYLAGGGSRAVAIQTLLGSAEYKTLQLTGRIQRLAFGVTGQKLTDAEVRSWLYYLQHGGAESLLVTALVYRTAYTRAFIQA